VVQLYGGYTGAQIGGGSVGNKTPEKVELFRSAWRALCGQEYRLPSGWRGNAPSSCPMQIGIARPISIYVHTFRTGIVSDQKIGNPHPEYFDLRRGE
jgi:S-adenosylmethionine synthetase